MDCEKFDQHVMDALYDELDELTHAALKRHMESCSRCASIYSGLRATRDVGVLPLEEPSDGLEDRILAAALAAQRKTPWHKKALRGLAWAGSHAMRPQLAMAALFVLVIGSSLLLLRPKPTSMPIPVRVTERGVPSPDHDEGAARTAGAPESHLLGQQGARGDVAGAEPPSPGAAIAEGREGAEGEKKKADSDTGAASDAKAALAEARAVRQKSGCGAAVKAYDDVGARFPATVAAADAMWEAAECYKSMGDEAKARELYTSLLAYASYRDRAQAELGGAMVAEQQESEKRVAVGEAPAPPAKAAPKASKAAAKPKQAAEAAAGAGVPAAAAPQPAPPAQQAGGSGGPNKNAAPMRSKAADADERSNSYGF